MFLGNKRKAGDDIMNATTEKLWQFPAKINGNIYIKILREERI